MKVNIDLVKELAESWCPNDIGIEDVDVNGNKCYKDECEECWIESLKKLKRKEMIE